jgi:hypothetical protein
LCRHTRRSPLARIKRRTLWRPIVTPRICKRRIQPATAIAAPTGLEHRPQMNAVETDPRDCTPPLGCGVKAGAADVKDMLCLADGDGLLLQVVNALVAHLSSRAKKAEAFLIVNAPRYAACRRRFGLAVPIQVG